MWLNERRCIILIATTGCCALTSWWLWKKRHRLKALLPGSQLVLEPREVHVVTKSSQWDELYPAIRHELDSCKLLGFDCEWVTLIHWGCRPVALVQLATPSGVCVLIRLLHMDEIPLTLQEILADKNILKLGVGCLGDAQRMLKDHTIFVRGCVDLRHIAVRSRLTTRGYGLKALSEAVLQHSLDKNLLIRASNWELEELMREQIHYAAMDALVGLKIFLVLINRKLGRPAREHMEPLLSQDWNKTLSFCQGIVDVNFQHERGNRVSVHQSRPSPNHTPSAPRCYSHRRRPLYHNCQLRAPDGQLLCTCDVKKANWYMEKGLGKKVLDDPLTIQLTFEPSGRPMNEKNYYLQDKKNVCVVCGEGQSYIRKNIVPHEYRKHFPTMLKEHRSHDVVLMCTMCHHQSSSHDAVLKERLVIKCDAPMSVENGAKYKVDHSLQQVKSAAKALLNPKAMIPSDRRQELSYTLKIYYGIDDLTDSLLQEASNIDIKQPNNTYTPHGKKVIDYIIENEGLVEFERTWRQHFLDNMKPKYMPPLWAVDHSHNELADLDQSIRNVICMDDQKSDTATSRT